MDSLEFLSAPTLATLLGYLDFRDVISLMSTNKKLVRTFRLIFQQKFAELNLDELVKINVPHLKPFVVNEVHRKLEEKSLENLVLKLKNKPWNKDKLIANPAISWPFITKFLLKDVDYKKLSHNPNLPWDFVMTNLDKDWNWSGLSNNNSVDLNFVFSHPEYMWNFIGISKHPNLQIEDVLTHLNLGWNWYFLTERYSWNDIKVNLSWSPDQGWSPDQRWNWETINIKEDLDWSFVEQNIKIWPMFAELSKNKSLDWNLVDKYPNLKWNWSSLSFNPSLFKTDFFENHLDASWDFFSLSLNSELDWQTLSKYPDILKKLNREHIAKNPNLNFDFIEQHKELINWPWYIIFSRKDLPFSVIKNNLHHINSYTNINEFVIVDWNFIEQHPNVNWPWSALSKNLSLSTEFVLNNLDKNWDFLNLWENPNIIHIPQITKRYEEALNQESRYVSLAFPKSFNLVLISPDKPWNWDILTETFGSSMSKKYPNLNWNFDILSKDPKLDWRFVVSQKDKDWNWDTLSQNKFSSDPKFIGKAFKLLE